MDRAVVRIQLSNTGTIHVQAGARSAPFVVILEAEHDWILAYDKSVNEHPDYALRLPAVLAARELRLETTPFDLRLVEERTSEVIYRIKSPCSKNS